MLPTPLAAPDYTHRRGDEMRVLHRCRASSIKNGIAAQSSPARSEYDAMPALYRCSLSEMPLTGACFEALERRSDIRLRATAPSTRGCGGEERAGHHHGGETAPAS
jgi:hypothetical protein